MDKDIKYVVVDLNVLISGLSGYLDDTCHVVMPHMMISDMAGNSKRKCHVKSMPKWLKDRGGQIWLAHDWGTLESIERNSGDTVVGLEWRDDSGSEELRLGGVSTSEDWDNYFTHFELSSERQTVEEGRSTFLELCRRIVDGLEINEPENIARLNASRKFDEDIVEFIRQPIYGHILGLIEEPDYRTHYWTERLNVYPDRFSFGRVSRIMCWYALLFAAKNRHLDGNDLEDLSYAHAASYTGYLATDDNDLKKMVRAIFPEVEIITKGR